MTEEIRLLAEELKKKLYAGKVSFTFLKKDGTQRTALGTTKMDLVPEELRPKQKDALNAEEPATFGPTQTYFDLDKNAWRSLQREKLISIN